MRAHAPLTITISLPSGSATRQRSSDSSRSRPPAATVVARRACARSDGTASSKWMRLRCRRRSVSDASSSWNTNTGFSRRGSWMSMTPARRSWVYPSAATQNAHCGDVGGVEEELSEARQPRIRSGPEFAGSGLEVSGEVGEVELEAVGVVFPLVLTAVDDHEPGAQVDQQREARVVGQRRCCGGQVTLLRRRGGAVARHRAEHRLPVGCPDPLAERVARHQVDLVAVGVGGRPRTVRMPHQDSPAGPPRPAVPRRGGCGFEAAAAPSTAGSVSRGCAATDPPNRRPPQARSRARAARTAHHRRVRGLEHDAQVLQHGRVRGQPEIPRGRRHRLGVLV